MYPNQQGGFNQYPPASGQPDLANLLQNHQVGYPPPPHNVGIHHHQASNFAPQMPPYPNNQMPIMSQQQAPYPTGAPPSMPIPMGFVSHQTIPQQQPFVQSVPAYPPMPQVVQAVPIHISHQVHSHAVQIPIQRGRPTVTPVTNFDASADAAILRKAMKGFGTDEKALINVICRRTNNQLVEIGKCFKTAYGKDLIEDVKSETSGHFEKLLVGLLTPRLWYYCEELNKAMEGAGTTEKVLIDIMCTKTNAEIRAINDTYKFKYGRLLESDLRGDTSGNFKRLMTSLSAGGRDESMMTDIAQARADAQALKSAGVDRWGTDESEFNRILCLRNYEQLKLVCDEYAKLSGNSLEKDIKKEFSGDVEKALLAIVRTAQSRPAYFARCLHKSMDGLGTDDNALIRLCVTRYDVDMMDIKEEFQKLFGKTLKSYIKGDTSGDYRRALLTLCGEE